MLTNNTPNIHNIPNTGQTKIVYLSSDHGGEVLRMEIFKLLSIDYPNLKIVDLVKENGKNGENQPLDSYTKFAKMLSKKVLETPNSLGIGICRSGQGMCITANKAKGIRAALIVQKEQLPPVLSHTMANIICLSDMFTKKSDIETIVKEFVEKSTFDLDALEPRHRQRLLDIDEE
jgi:ribose 5-phosphate isomerase B